jgi:hypothetical protein
VKKLNKINNYLKYFLLDEIFRPFYDEITKKFNDTPKLDKIYEISNLCLEEFNKNKMINPAINLFRELLEEAFNVRNYILNI